MVGASEYIPLDMVSPYRYLLLAGFARNHPDSPGSLEPGTSPTLSVILGTKSENGTMHSAYKPYIQSL